MGDKKIQTCAASERTALDGDRRPGGWTAASTSKDWRVKGKAAPAKRPPRTTARRSDYGAQD
jgi:hypothetical protein